MRSPKSTISTIRFSLLLEIPEGAVRKDVELPAERINLFHIVLLDSRRQREFLTCPTAPQPTRGKPVRSANRYFKNPTKFGIERNFWQGHGATKEGGVGGEKEENRNGTVRLRARLSPARVDPTRADERPQWSFIRHAGRYVGVKRFRAATETR